MPNILISEPFDELKTRDVRLVSEAAKLGDVTLCLWSDAAVERYLGRMPKFPVEERRYYWESCKYVKNIVDISEKEPEQLFAHWVMEENAATSLRRDWCERYQTKLTTISDSVLATFPAPPACPTNPQTGREKVIVTGCFDFFHTGHVRFFEEVNELGDLYVCVGHDENIRLLKGEGHPLFPAAERCFIADSVKFAKQGLVTSGNGWLDAEPEIERLRPNIYAVNEDGDKPAKREYCEAHGIEYVVLKRLPKPGLTRRSSTDLRGF